MSASIEMKIRRTTKELSSLTALIGKSAESRKRYSGLLEEFLKVFNELVASSINEDQLVGSATKLLDRAQRLNDSGENLDIKQMSTQFATRIKGLKPEEIQPFATSLLSSTGFEEFFALLMQEFSGSEKDGVSNSDSSEGKSEKSVLKILYVGFGDSGTPLDKYGLILPTTVNYIRPVVKFESAPKTSIELSYRLFSPTGEMEKNDDHPDGFLDTQVLTNKDDIVCFGGWGSTTGTAYYEGRWRFELYCGSELINTTYFDIKSPFSHIPPSIDIHKVEFANTDYDLNILNDFGSALPGNTQYLTPRVYYTVRNKENRKINLRYVIYGPDGTPRRNSARNDRYTASKELNLGWNSPAILPGFGNSDGNSYGAGRYKVEIYEEDYLLYTAYVDIGKPQASATPPITPPKKTDDKSNSGCFITLVLTAVVIAVIFGLMKWCSNENYETAEPSYVNTCQITGNGVNLRQGPGTEYDKLGVVVSSGETYPVLEYSGDWIKIDYNGTEAWLSSRFCTLVGDIAQGEEISDNASGIGKRKEKDRTVDYSERERIDESKRESFEKPSEESESLGASSERESSVVSGEESPAIETPLSKSQDDNTIYSAAEEAALFPGGPIAMMKWLSENIRYPESAQQNNKQGRVVVKFVVEKDGSISQPHVDYGIDKDLDKEALRVVSKMPKWTPAKSKGVPVRSYYTIPVTFRLQEQ